MCANTDFVAFPSASIPSAVFVRFAPSATMFRVKLRGGGPGLYFDFSRLSFHVPISGLSSATSDTLASVQIGGRVKRREFITLLGGAAVGWPLIARSQQAGARPTIGFLGPTTPSAQTQWITAFLERLGELGWVEGRTV